MKKSTQKVLVGEFAKKKQEILNRQRSPVIQRDKESIRAIQESLDMRDTIPGIKKCPKCPRMVNEAIGLFCPDHRSK